MSCTDSKMLNLVFYLRCEMALVCFTFGCVIFSADETGWVLYASVCTIVLHMNVKIKRRLGESLALAYSEYLEIFTGTWKRQPSSWGTCSRTWESQDYSIQVLSSVLDKYLSSTWSVKYLNILPSTFYITGAKYLSKYLRPVHRLGHSSREARCCWIFLCRSSQ